MPACPSPFTALLPRARGRVRQAPREPERRASAVVHSARPPPLYTVTIFSALVRIVSMLTLLPRVHVRYPVTLPPAAPLLILSAQQHSSQQQKQAHPPN